MQNKLFSFILVSALANPGNIVEAFVAISTMIMVRFPPNPLEAALDTGLDTIKGII